MPPDLKMASSPWVGGGGACVSPEQFDEGGYAARLEDGQQPLGGRWWGMRLT